MVIKRWVYNQASSKRVGEIALKYNIDPFLAEIIAGRNMGDDDVISLFEDTELESPFILKDMDKAVKRIEEAVKNSEKIVIYGDYDCDGITSTALIYIYLVSAGANVLYYMPDRLKEGYGLNENAINFLCGQKTNLIITVDNGISAVKEAELIKELGMDLIITDHHQTGSYIPEAVAVINPNRCDCPSKYKSLAGVGVTFKLVTALEGGDYNSALEYFSDIVAIGTIGDVVPLTSENRTLVKHGLKMMPSSDNLGINSLLEAASIAEKGISSTAVSYGIVPRINAAGRMETAEQAVDLFIGENEETAREIAENLNNLNKKRQSVESEIIKQIEEEFNKNPGKLLDRVIVVCGQNWNHGVIGIVSAKITERYGKPSFVLSEDGKNVNGSGRSIKGFSLYKALCECEELLIKFGGHSLAAGVTLPVENVEEFKRRVNEYAKANFPVMPVLEYTIDKIISLKEINIKNIKKLSSLEPFGQGNSQPVFLLGNVKIAGINSIGGDKHIKLRVEMENGMATVLYFGIEVKNFPYRIGQNVDILANMDINTYNGELQISIKLKDIRPAGFNQEKFINAKNTYEAFRRGEELDTALIPRIIPEYKEFGLVYKYLRAINGYNKDIDLLYFELGGRINYCKLRVILDVMEELKLISMNPFKITMLEIEGKVDLSNSKILEKIY